MKTILTLLIFSVIFTSTAYSIDCTKHKIYCKIKEVKPSMKNKEAMKLSNIIYKYTRNTSINPFIVIAIGMQESSLSDVIRKQKGYVKLEKCDDLYLCYSIYKEVEVYTDFGMFQFHIGTMKRYGINPDLVMDDLDYAVKQHVRILKDKIKFCKRFKSLAWSCYHSTTTKHRLKYINDVSRFL